MGFILKGETPTGLFLQLPTVNKAIRVADFLLSSSQIVTHSAWLSGSIHSILHAVTKGTSWSRVEGVLWERRAEAGWVAAGPSPSLLPHGQNKVSGWENWGGGVWGRRGKVQRSGGWSGGVCLLCRDMPLVIATHRKNTNWPE